MSKILNQADATDQEIILLRARKHAARYSRSRGRNDEAEKIERGEADQSSIMEVMVWLYTDQDGTPADIIIMS